MSEPVRAKKRFGQHFLSDTAMIETIANRFNAPAGALVIEIGPGQGAMTGPLLDRGYRVSAVEFDRDMVALLRRKYSHRDTFTLTQGDILRTRIADLTQGEQVHVFGNLPYNISSPILFHLLDELELIESMYFMLQKEVVQRICAEPGSRQYGRPSVMIQRLCHASMDVFVPPEAFSPPPKVDSAMLRLAPLSAPRGGVVSPRLFEQVVTAAFSQRRKTLRNTLGKLAGNDMFVAAGIDPGLRAEAVSIEQFAALANLIQE